MNDLKFYYFPDKKKQRISSERATFMLRDAHLKLFRCLTDVAFIPNFNWDVFLGTFFRSDHCLNLKIDYPLCLELLLCTNIRADSVRPATSVKQWNSLRCASLNIKGCLDWDSFATFLRLLSDADGQVRKRRDSFASTQVIELCGVRRVYHRESLYHGRLPAIERFCSLIVGRMEIAI